MGPLNREPLIFRPVRPFAWIITRQTQHIELYINHQSIYPLSPLCPYHCAVLSSGPFPGHLVLLVDWSVISLDIKSISKLIATFTSFWFQHLRRGEPSSLDHLFAHFSYNKKCNTQKKKSVNNIINIINIGNNIIFRFQDFSFGTNLWGQKENIFDPLFPSPQKKKRKKKEKKKMRFWY